MGKKHKCELCTKVIRKRHKIRKDGKDLSVCFGCKEKHGK